MSGPSVKALAAVTDALTRRLEGLVRRVVVSASAATATWKLLGVRLPDGTAEALTAELFSGIGFFARPPAGAKPEAILLNVGDARVPVIVATRDQKTLAAIAAALGSGKPAAGETIIFNAGAVVYLKADGTVEIRTPGGTAVALATKADVDALASHINTLSLPVVGGGGGTAGPPSSTAPSAAGTTVLKGE